MSRHERSSRYAAGKRLVKQQTAAFTELQPLIDSRVQQKLQQVSKAYKKVVSRALKGEKDTSVVSFYGDYRSIASYQPEEDELGNLILGIPTPWDTIDQGLHPVPTGKEQNINITPITGYLQRRAVIKLLGFDPDNMRATKRTSTSFLNNTETARYTVIPAQNPDFQKMYLLYCVTQDQIAELPIFGLQEDILFAELKQADPALFFQPIPTS